MVALYEQPCAQVRPYGLLLVFFGQAESAVWAVTTGDPVRAHAIGHTPALDQEQLRITRGDALDDCVTTKSQWWRLIR